MRKLCSVKSCYSQPRCFGSPHLWDSMAHSVNMSTNVDHSSNYSILLQNHQRYLHFKLLSSSSKPAKLGGIGASQFWQQKLIRAMSNIYLLRCTANTRRRCPLEKVHEAGTYLLFAVICVRFRASWCLAFP